MLRTASPRTVIGLLGCQPFYRPISTARFNGYRFTVIAAQTRRPPVTPRPPYNVSLSTAQHRMRFLVFMNFPYRAVDKYRLLIGMGDACEQFRGLRPKFWVPYSRTSGSMVTGKIKRYENVSL